MTSIKSVLPYVLGVACMMAYAYVIVALKELSYKYNVFVLSFSYLPLQWAMMTVGLGVMFGTAKLSGSALVFPHGAEWKLVLALAALYVVAQTLNFQTYATGGTVVMMGYLSLLIPIFTSMMGYFLRGETLNRWHAIGYAAAIIMMICIIKGGMVQKAAAAAQ